MNFTVLNRTELPRDGDSNTVEFEGYRFGEATLSFIWIDMQPGEGPRLHKHPYEEIFIIQEGRATYTVGSTTLDAQAGQVIVVPPDTPHKFVNSGEGPLRQIDIHASKRFITEWLED
jgi:mannose-6-phosphate isomerase-like protein (cupin superfamily)